MEKSRRVTYGEMSSFAVAHTMNPLYGYSSIYPSYGDIYTALGQRLNMGSPYLSVSVQSQADAYALDLSAYGKLLSSLETFQYAVNGLSTASQNNMLTAASSNTAVATATAATGAPAGNYTLNVSQLAQAETLSSGAFTDSAGTLVGSGTLTIQTGSYQPASNSFTAGTSTTINISNGTLDSIAAAINSAGAGVVANVLQGDDGYHLSLTQSATGAQNNMSITVVDSDGNNTNLSGLSQLAYDPTATSGSGKNLSKVQSAQNALYSVNGVNVSSASNTAVKVADNLYATLLQTGRTQITTGVDNNQLNSGTQSLADAFNDLRASLNQLLSSSSALQNDAQVSRLISDLNFQAITSIDNNNSTLTSLPQIGLYYQAPDKSGPMAGLRLDNNTLQAAYQLDQGGAASLLALSARAFNVLSQAYTSNGQGSISQTMSQLQQWGSQLKGASNTTQGASVPYSLAAMLAQATNGTAASRSQQFLSAQQITALAQYSMVLAMGPMTNIRSLENRMIDQIPWLGNNNGISVFA